MHLDSLSLAVSGGEMEGGREGIRKRERKKGGGGEEKKTGSGKERGTWREQ